MVALATTDEQTAYVQPGIDSAAYAYGSNAPTPASSEHSVDAEGNSRKRKDAPLPTGKKPVKKTKPDAEGEEVKDVVATKSKRVRTGCLTCRERHLKCDEAMPHCNNCRKSNRVCKRGVRLNFIDMWEGQPPTLVSKFGTREWRVGFKDESREIASEYQGGLEKYSRLESEVSNNNLQNHNGANNMMHMDPNLAFGFASSMPPAPSMGHQHLPPNPLLMASADAYSMPPQADLGSMYDQFFKSDGPTQHLQPPHSGSTVETHNSGNSNASSIHPGSVGSYNLGPGGVLHVADEDRKDFLDNQEETLFMQVFVEEVGLWMDSMDPHKHFSRLLPFHSLSEPMLLSAFLACGARHLTLINEAFSEEKALHYYDTATRYLLKNLQDPNRDTVICATTAVILNVYEIMSERALQRMNHIAGARALIKECGWNARSSGVGSACFWLNVGLEVLSCLHFNWQTAWDPDDWGVDMEFSREMLNGREEIWTHRMLYIIAKVCNFRATIPKYADSVDQNERQMRTQQRYEEWLRLKGMADAWNDGIPRTMHPMAFLYAYQTSSKSCFPEVWLIKRSTVVARLFYHTAQLLLAQTNPYTGSHDPTMADLQTRHSQMICGIAAHVKDRGVASVAIRSLAHAAEVLKERHEQEEVVRIFEKINRETGWRIGFVYAELRAKWGWEGEVSEGQWEQTHTAARLRKEAEDRMRHEQATAGREAVLREQAIAAQNLGQGLPQQFGGGGQGDFGSAGLMQTLQPMPQGVGPPPVPALGGGAAPQRKKMPEGIPNPMFSKADFNLPQHPYQNFYVPPNHISGTWSDGGGMQQAQGQFF